MQTPSVGRSRAETLSHTLRDDDGEMQSRGLEPTEHPDVARRREPSEVDGFWSHPLDGEFSFRCWRNRDRKDCVFRSDHDNSAQGSECDDGVSPL